LFLNRFIATLACLTIALLTGAAAAEADPAPTLPPGPVLPKSEWPDDPSFARCETQDPVTGCQDSEQWNLYGPMDGLCLAPGGAVFDQPRPDGGLPCWARNATDPESSSGINTTGAWAQGNIGRDDILIAYVEGGVNYSSNGIKDGLDAIYLNPGELPYPQGWDGQDLGRFDFDGNGQFDIRDYAKDPRVNPGCQSPTTQFTVYEEGTTRGCANDGQHPYLHSVNIGGPLTPYLSPEDLIDVFGDCRITDHRVDNCSPGTRIDNDGNGYPNDISGWNAYQNTNDPQTEDRAYNHASGLMGEMGGEADNNYAGVGNCRDCRIVPVKSGAESVGKADGLAPAITYAADVGVDAMSTVVVSYAYSSALKAAVKHAVDEGILMSMDSNDFDAMDHTDGHLFDDVFPGNGIVQDVEGKNVRTFRARSNVTSYGTHSLFAGGETTTSGATPFQAAFLAMVQSAAKNAVDEPSNPYKRPLTPNEVKQVLINTASEILPQRDTPWVPNQWPGNPGSKTDSTHTAWSTQYGYGRPNIGKATKLIMDGRVPPTADINSPDWYRYVDPTKGGKLQVKGKVAPSAWGSDGVAWTLEWALGADPADSAFKTISTGKAAKSGVLGTLNLKDIPASYAKKAPAENVMPPTGPEQYTVTIRLRARDGNGLKGEDRRSIGARADRDLVEGYPKSIGTEMSAAPSFVDLGGRRQLDLVFGTMDGQVSAIQPNGSQAPGFPVYTWKLADIDPNNPQNFNSEAYDSVQALRDARDPVSGIAVGDLDGNGAQSIVATTTSGWVYVWNAAGKLRDGFPVHGNDQYNTLPVPTPDSGCRRCRLPIRGNWSPPALGNLEGQGKLSILMSSYDGHVYAWRADGSRVPGWPVEVKLPQTIKDTIAPGGYIRDPKLMMTPAVGDVLGTGTDQVFLPGFECDDAANKTFAYGIQSDGNNNPGGPYLPGWPVRMGSIAGCYSQSIDFVQEGGNAASIADVDGSGELRVAITPVAGAPIIFNGNGSTYKGMTPGCSSAPCSGYPPYYQPDAITVGVTSQSAFGDLNGDGKPEFMQPTAGGTTLTNALGDAGQAALPHVFDQAWNPVTGEILENFPTNQDGFPFYTSPVVGNLTEDDNRSMIAANDSYWIHARGPDGEEAPGFPKWTGQWTSFGGAIADPKFDNRQYLAYGTREGQLFLWKVGGKPSMNNQWWHYRHDEHNSGRYGNDTRPPAGVRFVVRRSRNSARITWRASGDDGVSGGKVAVVQVYKSKRKISLSQPGSRLKSPTIAKPNGQQTVNVKLAPKKSLYIAVRQKDGDGNWSSLSRFKIKPFKSYNLKKQKRLCRSKFNPGGKQGAARRRAVKRRSSCIREAEKKAKQISRQNEQRS